MSCKNTTRIVQINNSVGGNTSITSIDFQPTGNPNEYTVVLTWVDSNGVTQTTTDPTPVTIEGQTPTRLQCFEEPGNGLPEGNDVTATYDTLSQFAIAFANATQDANNLIKVDFLVGGVPVHTMLGGGEYPVLVPAGGGGFPPSPATLQYVHSSINPNWEAANVVLTGANLSTDTTIRLTEYSYTAGSGGSEATISQTGTNILGLGNPATLVVNAAGVPAGGTFSVWTYEDGSQRAFNDLDNSEVDITGGIPVTWLPCPSGANVSEVISFSGGNINLPESNGPFQVDRDGCYKINYTATFGNGNGGIYVGTTPFGQEIPIVEDPINNPAERVTVAEPSKTYTVENLVAGQDYYIQAWRGGGSTISSYTLDVHACDAYEDFDLDDFQTRKLIDIVGDATEVVGIDVGNLGTPFDPASATDNPTGAKIVSLWNGGTGTETVTGIVGGDVDLAPGERIQVSQADSVWIVTSNIEGETVFYEQFLSNTLTSYSIVAVQGVREYIYHARGSQATILTFDPADFEKGDRITFTAFDASSNINPINGGVIDVDVANQGLIQFGVPGNGSSVTLVKSEVSNVMYVESFYDKSDVFPNPVSQHDFGVATVTELSSIQGTQAHFEGGAGYNIDANNYEDNYFGTFLTTAGAGTLTFSNFAGAFFRNGFIGVPISSPYTLPQESHFRVEIVENGGSKFLNIVQTNTSEWVDTCYESPGNFTSYYTEINYPTFAAVPVSTHTIEFTPSSGNVDMIRMNIKFDSGSGSGAIEVRTGSGAGPVIATSETNNAIAAGDLTFDFAAPVPLVNGTNYFITFSPFTDQTSEFAHSEFGIGGSVNVIPGVAVSGDPFIEVFSGTIASQNTVREYSNGELVIVDTSVSPFTVAPILNVDPTWTECAVNQTVINQNDLVVDDQAASGYMDFGDKRIQWGTSSGGDQSITLPAPMLNDSYNVQLTATGGALPAPTDNVTRTAMSGSKTTTSFYIESALTAITFDWVVRGLKP